MVSYKEIKASNALINEDSCPRVAVFVGGTSGIGKFTVKALVGSGGSLRIYLIGRKNSEGPMKEYIEDLKAVNAKAEVIWVEGDVSLLAETQRVCEHIKSKESRVDLLFLSTGYAPFGPRQETTEGIEIAQSLEYYSRILCLLQLLPLLNSAPSPRVVSVLGGGMEKTNVDLDDMDLKKPGNFGGVRAQGQYITMNSTTLEKIAHENPKVTLIHAWPGIVSTGNVKRGRDPNSVVGWIVRLVVEPILTLIGTSEEECGQRYLFQITSALFGGRGVSWQGKPGRNTLDKEENGLFLVNYSCDCTSNAKVMGELRQSAQEKIWEHSLRILGNHVT